MTARESDTKLLALLRANAREPAASLARKLGLARSTVQERIARLEREGTIRGYTVRLSDAAEAGKLRAVVMIETDPKRAERVSAELKKMPEVRSLAAVAGTFDLIATVGFYSVLGYILMTYDTPIDAAVAAEMTDRPLAAS